MQLCQSMSPEMEHGERAPRKTQINTALGPHCGAGEAKADFMHCRAWSGAAAAEGSRRK